MLKIEIELNPTYHLTADAIGQPGKRVFYIQGKNDETTITLLIEKLQLQSLVNGMMQFLTEIRKKFSNLAPASGNYVEDSMHIPLPLDPLFRVGEMGLAYDTDRDLICLILKEIVVPDMIPEDADTVRFWCSRDQILQLANWGIEIISRGRPICPQCGEPMEPEGHFCPKKNGHKH